jgi:MGT family glycosyltransferase
VSRFLITCWPFYGHLLNQVGVARALRERGHQVAFYTDASARRLVEGEGFELHPFQRVDGAAIAAAVAELEQRAGAGRPRLADVRRCFDRCLIEPLRGQVDDVSELIAHRRPDVIVCDVPVWGPMVVLWETTGIPVALSSIFLGPTAPTPQAPPPGLGLPSPRGPARRVAARAAGRATDLVARRIRGQVDAVRAEHGLAPMGCSVNAFMGRLPATLIPGVPELDYDRREVPPRVHYVGPLAWQPPAPPSDAWSPDVLAAGRPVVHVAASTMAGADATLLRAAVQGLASLPVEVVVTGGGSLPEDLRRDPVPANVHLADWVDHASLLPRCDVVVTAGGSATVVAALAAGVPLVVVPTAWDKPDNAQRVAESGAGVRLAPRNCTPERLRDAVEQVRARPSFRAQARRLAILLARAPGPAGAADVLESLVVPAAAAALVPEAVR